MAEQDRPDAVPAVLNDLMDVDGTPTEGDGLAYSTGAWRPGPAAGLLPELGPALTFWQGASATATLNDESAVLVAWNAATPVRAFTDYPGDQPILGAWRAGTTGTHIWEATEPGIYEAHVATRIQLNGAGATTGKYVTRDSQSLVIARAWGPDTHEHAAAGTVFHRTEDRLTMNISQGMIDGGIGGFQVGYPAYVTGGSERPNQVSLYAFIERYSPGSAFDYYGEL